MGQASEQVDPFYDISNEPCWEGKLSLARKYLNENACRVDRIGIALYDDSFDKLRTFSASPLTESPLHNYEFTLSDSESLSLLKHSKKPRIVNDMEVFSAIDHEHTKKIHDCGYRSSYTVPCRLHDKFLGFIFFNSLHENNFCDTRLDKVSSVGHFMSQMVVNYNSTLTFMLASIRSTIGIVGYKDPETGNHLKRLASLSRLIARELVSEKHADLTDEQIDLISHFAPMHDIGKIGTPDQILLKPAPLEDEEWEIMKQHPSIGRHITEQLVSNFGFQDIPHIEFLHHIVEFHHEKLNGRGYPRGLMGEDVPLAARIVATCDVFDALTNERPYKKPWTNQDAFAEMFKMAHEGHLDYNCVQALFANEDAVMAIQRKFSDRSSLH